MKGHQYRRPAPDGVEGAKLGKVTEQRFLDNCQSLRTAGSFPTWLQFFCAAEPHEDAEGVDVWAYTDVGKIPLQIKRSTKLRTQFLKRENRKHIPCIAFSPAMRFSAVFSFTLSVLRQERNKLLREKETPSS
jgi:hypothetical protein